MDSDGQGKPRGPKCCVRGLLAPPQAPLGADKMADTHQENGFWNPPPSKCVVSKEIQRFTNKQNRSRRGPWTVFPDLLGAPGGGQGPSPGVCVVLLGGPGGPLGAVPEIQGGPGRPQGGHFLFRWAVLSFWANPKSLKNNCVLYNFRYFRAAKNA